MAARARPCAARTRLFELIATPNGALRAPPRPLRLRCFLFDPQKYLQPIELGPPSGRPRQGLFSFHWTTEAMKYEIPCPRPAHRSFADPSDNIFGVNLCTDATIRPNYFGFFSIVFGSFLFVILFFFSPLHYRHIRHSEGFFKGAKPISIHFGVKINVYTGATIVLTFFVFSFFVFSFFV